MREKVKEDMSDDTQYLDEMHRHYENARRDLSDHRLMERTIIAGLLRVLEIQYEDREIQKKGPEPIDVWFRCARFQVTEILDEGRRRDAELYKQQQKLENAKSLIECFEPVCPGHDSLNPTACSLDDYFQLIHRRSQEKLKKYGQVNRDIDFLVYINRRSIYLYPTEPWPAPTPLMQDGWRSVVFVDNRYARVLYANDDAPAFLQDAVGRTRFWEKGSHESMFPQQLEAEEESS